jgi:hypothetical protein
VHDYEMDLEAAQRVVDLIKGGKDEDETVGAV